MSSFAYGVLVKINVEDRFGAVSCDLGCRNACLPELVELSGA